MLKTIIKFFKSPLCTLNVNVFWFCVMFLFFSAMINVFIIHFARKNNPMPSQILTDSLRQEVEQLKAERSIYQNQLQDIQTKKIYLDANLQILKDSLSRRSAAAIYDNWK